MISTDSPCYLIGGYGSPETLLRGRKRLKQKPSLAQVKQSIPSYTSTGCAIELTR